MARFWIAVASLEHVLKAIAGSFAQVCHGKPGPLKRMKGSDWIIFYSPTETFGGNKRCQRFTAIGKVTVQEPYQFAMSEDFIPWRRNVTYIASHEVAIEVILDKLAFIKDKSRWGFPFRRGCFEISETNFRLIAKAMGIKTVE